MGKIKERKKSKQKIFLKKGRHSPRFYQTLETLHRHNPDNSERVVVCSTGVLTLHHLLPRFRSKYFPKNCPSPNDSLCLHVCIGQTLLARETQCLVHFLVIYTTSTTSSTQTVATMRSLAMVVAVLVLAMVVVEGQYYGGGSCDWSQCRYDRC